MALKNRWVLPLWFCLLLAPAAWGYQLVWSESADRTAPQPLNGPVVSGDIYVFVDQDAGLDQVKFYIDGTLVQTEGNAPWDLGGTESNKNSRPYSTLGLSDGPHTITATLLADSGGTTELSGSIVVDNNVAALLVSPSTVNLSAAPGDTTSASVNLSTSNNQAVSFTSAENASWLTVTPSSGTTPAALSLEVNTLGLSPGPYQTQLSLSADGYSGASVTVTLSVANDSDDARQLHLAWDQGPDTITAIWQTDNDGTASRLQYRASGSGSWRDAYGAVRHTTEEGIFHEVSFSGLQNDTDYDYRVMIRPGVFSQVYQTRSAPAVGQEWDLVYFADTGLLGRSDGLGTGVQASIDAMIQLDPDLLLPGGDLIYYNSDRRYETLDRSIDAWFNQMVALAPRIPMMPTWGNHEVLLGEDYATWAARFATTSGWEGSRMYAFDVADVHFISVYGLRENDGMPDEALAWLTNHLASVADDGYRWIVAYFHAAPFSDGSNHPSAKTLRAQLGPIFEQYGVKLVLTSHDQSYERTFPLVDVPKNNTPTTTALDCYDRSEGTSWVKVSPAGKLSNRNKDFSDWNTDPPPYWTAMRDNTAHHVGRVNFTADGAMEVTIYSILDGQTPWIIDRFKYADSCDGSGGALSASPTQFNQQLEPGQTATASLRINQEGGGTVSLSESVNWLSLSPTSGNAPLDVTLSFNAGSLAAGSYATDLLVTGQSGARLTIPVLLQVGSSDYQLLLSGNAQRSGAVPLQGQTVSGDIYVFVGPEEGVNSATFFLGQQTLSQVKREGVAPYDLGGTASNRDALPFDTTTLADGQYQMRVDLNLDSGTVSRYASFTIANDGAPPPAGLSFAPTSLALSLAQGGRGSLSATLSAGSSTSVSLQSSASWLTVSPDNGQTPLSLQLELDASTLAPGSYNAQVTASGGGSSATLPVQLTVNAVSGESRILLSLSPDRSAPVLLEGQSVSGDIYVFIAPEEGPNQVRFYLDDPSRSDVEKVENYAPWDLAGTGGGSKPALPFDTSTLSAGEHLLSVEVISDSGVEVLEARFTVSP
ncbi:BACON domain-containing protein [Ferrimonas balearica]|uniref:BACON domain-containing protein n=1 Tax=Ferrimonas balearica TaxID=44012 RepID=UPI001C99C191|nr:fibronectin type III domain-containing protein [Ferrimonas balearica]MBY5921537.1 metallophosphoesterase [Ferrimonas balearica]MBY5995123.1 metallophosphoesterase [Ferrimonas balearica]